MGEEFVSVWFGSAALLALQQRRAQLRRLRAPSRKLRARKLRSHGSQMDAMVIRGLAGLGQSGLGADNRRAARVAFGPH